MRLSRMLVVFVLGTIVAVTAATAGARINGAQKTTTITFWNAYSSDGPEVKRLDKVIIPQFQKTHPGIVVKDVPIPYDSLHQKLVTGIAGGQLPDLVRSDIIWVPELANLGVLEPLDKTLPDFKKLAATTFAGPLATNYWKGDIKPPALVFIVATLIALPMYRWLEKRWPVMPLVGGFFVLVFGGLTIWLQDDTFIKLKPTIVNCLFGVILGGGLLLLNRPLLKPIFGAAFRLTDEGWRKLTVRWALFFLALAVLNEIVWRTQSTDTWVTFEVFGVMPITFIFAAFQYPLLMKHDATPKDEAKS